MVTFQSSRDVFTYTISGNGAGRDGQTSHFKGNSKLFNNSRKEEELFLGKSEKKFGKFSLARIFCNTEPGQIRIPR